MNVELDEWEGALFAEMVNARLVTYLGHYDNGGLKEHEIAVMNRLRVLSDKLEAAGV